MHKVELFMLFQTYTFRFSNLKYSNWLESTLKLHFKNGNNETKSRDNGTLRDWFDVIAHGRLRAFYISLQDCFIVVYLIIRLSLFNFQLILYCIMSLLPGFVKGQSDNLPKIDALCLFSFLKNHPDFMGAEMRGVKANRYVWTNFPHF